VKLKSLLQCNPNVCIGMDDKCRLENPYIVLTVTCLVQHTKFMQIGFNFIID